MLRQHLVAAISLLILATVSRGDNPSLQSHVDGLVRPIIADEWAVGMAVGVYHKANRWTAGYGKLALDDSKTPDDRTVYEIGSVTKTFTGLLLADMVERGQMKLDDPVSKYLPESVKPLKLGERDMTLLDLTTHSSGLPRMPNNFAPKDANNPYADYTPDQLYAALNSFTDGAPLRSLGKAFLLKKTEPTYDYSNLGVGLLGHVLERASGQDYESLLKSRITGPLGMTSTGVKLTDEMKARLAPPYDCDCAANYNWDIATLTGAGAIRSDVHDMLRYAEANLGIGAGELGPAIKRSHEIYRGIKGIDGMALGWHHDDKGDFYWHNGQTGGYHSMVLFDRKNQFAVVILTNTATGAIDGMARNILEFCKGGKPTPLKLPAQVSVSPETLEQYVGEYQLAPLAKFIITRDGDKLLAKLASQPAFRVYPKSETEFYYRVVPARITFEKDKDGKTTKLTLHQNGRDMPAPRIDPKQEEKKTDKEDAAAKKANMVDSP